jgi:hypothetical protein
VSLGHLTKLQKPVEAAAAPGGPSKRITLHKFIQIYTPTCTAPLLPAAPLLLPAASPPPLLAVPPLLLPAASPASPPLLLLSCALRTGDCRQKAM